VPVTDYALLEAANTIPIRRNVAFHIMSRQIAMRQGKGSSFRLSRVPSDLTRSKPRSPSSAPSMFLLLCCELAFDSSQMLLLPSQAWVLCVSLYPLQRESVFVPWPVTAILRIPQRCAATEVGAAVLHVHDLANARRIVRVFEVSSAWKALCSSVTAE